MEYLLEVKMVTVDYFPKPAHRPKSPDAVTLKPIVLVILVVPTQPIGVRFQYASRVVQNQEELLLGLGAFEGGRQNPPFWCSSRFPLALSHFALQVGFLGTGALIDQGKNFAASFKGVVERGAVGGDRPASRARARWGFASGGGGAFRDLPVIFPFRGTPYMTRVRISGHDSRGLFREGERRGRVPVCRCRLTLPAGVVSFTA